MKGKKHVQNWQSYCMGLLEVFLTKIVGVSGFYIYYDVKMSTKFGNLRATQCYCQSMKYEEE